MADRQGVEIDYCPKCRGVWLDRGELDKIIERASATPTPERREQDEAGRQYEKYDDDYARGQHKRKRKSFLGEMFDFD
jgi:hypothetical protein